MPKELKQSSPNSLNRFCNSELVPHRPWRCNSLLASAKASIHRVLQLDEVIHVLSHGIDPGTAPQRLLCIFAGLRATEAQRAEWDDLHFADGEERRLVVRSEGKTTQLRTVYICAALAAWLQPYHGLRGLVDSSGSAARRFKSYMKSSGIPATMPNLRRTYATYRLLSAQSHFEVASELGCSPELLNWGFWRRGIRQNRKDAERLFALSPATCDRLHWREEVAEWRKARSL
jgi:hypothetical protein